MRHTAYIVLTIAALIASACGRRTATSTEAFTRQIYTPHYASGFAITGTPDGDAVLIETSSPWQGPGPERRRLVIGNTNLAADPDMQSIQKPARRIVCMSSTHVAMLGAIGCSDRIVGVSGLDFISDPYVNAPRDTIADVGYEPDVDY